MIIDKRIEEERMSREQRLVRIEPFHEIVRLGDQVAEKDPPDSIDEILEYLLAPRGADELDPGRRDMEKRLTRSVKCVWTGQEGRTLIATADEDAGHEYRLDTGVAVITRISRGILDEQGEEYREWEARRILAKLQYAAAIDAVNEAAETDRYLDGDTETTSDPPGTGGPSSSSKA